MTKRKRRNRSPQEKAELLKKHHLEKKPVHEICGEIDLQPSVFYHWQRELFERAPQVFEAGAKKAGSDTRTQQLERENAALKAKLAKKDEVIAEISAEYVALKKELGEP
jgi:transposase